MKKAPIYLLALAAPIGPMTYQCDHNMPSITATFYQIEPTAAVMLSRQDQTVIISQGMSGSGARYEGAGIEFWIKGNDAFVTWQGKAFSCSTQRQAAAAKVPVI